MTRKQATKPRKPSSSIAGLLAWVFPGLGHWYLGHRARAVTIMVALTLTFWCGVAIGGVKSTVDPVQNRLWFLAQICTGSHTIVAAIWSSRLAPVVYKCPSCDSLLGGKPHAGEVCGECNEAVLSLESATHTRLAFWPQSDIAIVYTGIAGLLNVLVILDAIARAEIGPLARRRTRGGSADA